MPEKYRKLAGAHVLVIGGSSGIGFAVAEASLASGASVTISSSSADRIAAAIERLKAPYPRAKISGYACDLTGPALERNIEELFEKTGKLDHIVFTAGGPLLTLPIEEITLEYMQAAGQVRFFAPMFVAKIGRKYLKEGPQSSITLTTGSAAERPRPGWSVVSAFAAGLHGMIKGLALDLAPARVNLVSPGAVETELWHSMPEAERNAMFKEMADKNITKHVGKPEEVAEAYLWLMKDSNVTGTVARSDSGGLLV